MPLHQTKKGLPAACCRSMKSSAAATVADGTNPEGATRSLPVEVEVQSAAEPAAEETDDDADLKSFLAQFSWTKGPATGKLGDVAELNLPEGFRLANGDDTRKVMAAFGNLTSDQELGLVAPDSFDWFIVFEFDPVGYVKDDEKDDLKPDEMMDSIKRGTEFANEERAKMGIPGMTILGWQLPPRYNDQTKLLEWSIRAESEGSEILNHNTRILGRHGVMEAALVVDPEDIEATLPVFYSLLEGYGFQSGQKYAEYQDGDKIAKYGLAALIVGGGAIETTAEFQQWFLEEIRAGLPPQREEQADIPIAIMPNGDTAGARGAAIEARRLLAHRTGNS